MNLLFYIVICGLLQLVVLKPLSASNITKITAFKQELMEFYDNEMESIDKDFCKKAKILSEKLLQDKLIKLAKTPLLKKFKRNITDFLQEYPSYLRYGLTNQLVFLFEDGLPQPSNSKDTNYIWQLLEKLGYYQMDEEYKNKHVKIFKQRFSQKFTAFKQQLIPKELKQYSKLINWCKGLSNCLTYDCQLKYLTKLQDGITPKDKLYEYIEENLDNIHIFYGNTVYNIAKAVLKNKTLSQLSNKVKLDLTNNIKNFADNYEKHQYIAELYSLVNQFYNNVLLKYYYNTNLTSKEQKLIQQIFDGQGYAKFVKDYSNKLNNFVHVGLFKKFKQFKAHLTHKELTQEKPLLQWYDGLKSLHTAEDIATALDNWEEFFF